MAAPLTPGNLVVVRVGDGSAALSSSATPVFLDEYTPRGALVQSIAMPTAVEGANRILTNSGSAASEGALNRSLDGRFLTLAGYDAVPGTANVVLTHGSEVNRIVARVDATGVVDTSTRLSDAYSTNMIRGAVTDDGTRFWTAGIPSGVVFVPLGNDAAPTTQLSSAPTNVRVPSIYNGQLYVSSGSSPFNGVNQVGTGLPTTGGQTTTLLPGLPNGNPLAFVLLDREPDVVPGVDTLYVADQTRTKGLLKYTFADGTSWTPRGNITGVLTGLSATMNGSNVTLYATLGTAAGNALVTFTDTAAFDANISAGPFTILATAAANTVFRGVAFAPDSNQ
jgi:hypothetical protein